VLVSALPAEHVVRLENATIMNEGIGTAVAIMNMSA
jgi:hypothetical protein